jgi:hypothetical protein
LILIDELARGDLEGGDSVEAYLDEAFEDAARQPDCPVVGMEIVNITSGTAVYDFPSTAIRLRDLFFDNKFLYAASDYELESYLVTWRSLSGAPFAYTIEDETKRQFRLVPNPNVSTAYTLLVDPLGVDYPDNPVVAFFTEKRETVPDWLGFYFVFAALSPEFRQPSNHQDNDFSRVCAALAQLHVALTGGWSLAT